MVSEKMVAWGSQGCVIRDLAAYGEQRAAVVGAENVFNFTIGNPSVPAPSCVRQTIEHLLQTVPAEQLHAYTAAPALRPSARRWRRISKRRSASATARRMCT